MQLRYEPLHEIYNNVAILTCVDWDEPMQPHLSLKTPNGVQSVA